MPQSPYDPVGLFHSQVSDAVLRSVVRAVMDGYRESYQYCSENYSWEERHDVTAHDRRARIERNVRSVLVRYAPNVRVEPTQNKTKNAWHNQITVGRVVMTVNAVTNPGDMVRDADFRQQYARECQGNLFGDDEPPPPDAPLYAVLIHGPESKPDGDRQPAPGDAAADGQARGFRRRVLDRPAFLQIGFPDQELRRYVGDLVDMYRRFPDFGDEGQSGAERVPLPVVPPLRPAAEQGD